jgi:hypothetical protein
MQTFRLFSFLKTVSTKVHPNPGRIVADSVWIWQQWASHTSRGAMPLSFTQEISRMKQFFTLGLVATVMAGAMNMSNAADLKSGDDAPDFELKGSDGKTYKLSDFKGKQAVVIAWYPKAFTGG